MFNSIRRRGAALGMAALAMLGLGQNANSVATPPTPRPTTKKQARQVTSGLAQRMRLRGWTRARDLLPQRIQDARLIAAVERRNHRNKTRYYRLIVAVANYHLDSNRQIDLTKIHPTWPHRLIFKTTE